MIIENSRMTIDHVVRRWALDEGFLVGRMSFISGPRQIGKTSLAQRHLESLGQQGHYHSWDSIALRRRFAQNPLFFIENLPPAVSSPALPSPNRLPWVVFDEIHKYPRWKNILKGYYDEWRNRIRFIVTGSARLDYFRRSGDSLVGRYFLFRMNPLHPNDLAGRAPDMKASWTPHSAGLAFDVADREFSQASSLLNDLTGFPEPLVMGTREFYERWKNQHISLITGEDARDLSRIVNLRKLETLVFLLPERVGAPLSLNSLRAALDCAHASVENWLETLKKVYLVFDIAPYAGKLKRSVVKERKFYFWDWGMVNDPGKRFENYAAVMLARAVSAWSEWGKGDFRLHYLRTREGREVDFLITDKQKPLLLVECKSNEKSLDPSVSYFKERLGVPFGFQVVNMAGVLRQAGPGVFIVGIDRFLRLLP
ncbi:MAG: ATP-binding protein [Candidatus Aminicenantes bacterium]|nr:ATP-binding protein [Candidatus Aminicenantes bacterium]